MRFPIKFPCFAYGGHYEDSNGLFYFHKYEPHDTYKKQIWTTLIEGSSKKSMGEKQTNKKRYMQFQEGFFYFYSDDIKHLRRATKEEIEFGKKTLQEWNDAILIEDL